MAKVKPYIITVKYISVYADPAPTEEQILAELNIDALEVHIELATVAAMSKVTAVKEEAAVEIPAAPAPVRANKKSSSLMDFDIKHLSVTGPSIQVLTTLRRDGPKTLAELREATGNYNPSLQVSVCRMKAQGRVKVVGSGERGKALYAFVK